jgi:hypothetical protein
MLTRPSLLGERGLWHGQFSKPLLELGGVALGTQPGELSFEVVDS